MPASPVAEIEITLPLVSALVAEQFPSGAGLKLEYFGRGWDNELFRLGPGLLVRLPRRAVAAPLAEKEAQWLPPGARVWERNSHHRAQR